ncbi:MAG: DUF4199 domain-containing protein [Bacteroidia bacterium]|nr:DUF4199 domain-containing protein [Bacteroidia bacterium]
MKSYQLELKWAGIFVGMTLLWMLGEKLAGLHSTYIEHHPTYSNLIAIPAITIYVLALLEKRRVSYGGSMTWLQGFISGMIITGMVTVVCPLTQIITSQVISPAYFPNVIRYTVEHQMMSQEAAEQYFSLPSYIVQSTIGTAIIGTVTAALVALFTQRKAAVSPGVS